MNHLEVEIMSKPDNKAIVQVLGANVDALAHVKCELSSVFEKVGSFLLTTCHELDAFKKLIRPYVDYFYPPEITPDRECFVNEVVTQSRIEMQETINRAVEIIQGDAEVNARVSQSIEEALEMRPIVSDLLSMIEAIETYSWNAMLISTKAGFRGQALATISKQLSDLSISANATASQCTELLTRLDAQYSRFGEIIGSIDVIAENYFTSMVVKSGMIFKEMVQELELLSKSVNEILSFADTIESTAGELLGRLQMEDLIRQNVEKIALISQELVLLQQDEGILCECDEPEIAGEFFLSVLAKKADYVYHQLEELMDDTAQCNAKIKEIINKFLDRFYGRSATQDDEFIAGKGFDSVCVKLETMKDEFVGYIERIIGSKREMNELLHGIVATIQKFGPLFDEMGKIARRFEIINMLTKIELAKHADLAKSIGGSLTHVSNLPARMKKIVESALVRHRQVMASVEGSLAEYATSFKAEEETLERCIVAMKKISIKMYESQKYYRDISEKIGSAGMGMLAFLETGAGEMSSGHTLVEILYNFMYLMDGRVREIFDECVRDHNLRTRLECVSNRLRELHGKGDSRAGFMNSIYSEMMEKGEKRQVVVF